MKINNIRNMNNLQNSNSIKSKKIESVPKTTNENAAVFEKSKPEDKGHVYNKPTIEQLKKESDKSFANLKRMIENMLQKQGTTLKLLEPDELVNIDEATRAEASEMIGDNGPYGIEAMSDTIVDFAKAISGGDKSKLDKLIAAIDKGFSEAGKILGGLPEISMKTYDRIMEKLDIWKNE